MNVPQLRASHADAEREAYDTDGRYVTVWQRLAFSAERDSGYTLRLRPEVATALDATASRQALAELKR